MGVRDGTWTGAEPDEVAGRAGEGGIKAGAGVSAQLTGTPGHLTAIAIQDPAGAS